ncbi:uncharacterized protein K452DRAFT_283912 [Aplosporella prunicola CBS 121167]|uniref:C2H2-type domain-containing protein n=1 Tax=Aplosporella prunicola CBS 121167 TaxID=1176127 RepID=A0A6A6BQH3_9PEZI|nr:uncharacterized protein K452DRAFT_283912 [Aplosporella prunicola CBS 121167]KAF2145555.1 hypothetical protein K452DRAFT_283912 [Aplosporella prunicola CBS 121167]
MTSRSSARAHQHHHHHHPHGAMDSPGSPLSELSSDDFPEDVKTEDHRSLSVDTFHDHDAEHDSLRPAKRQRTTGPASSVGVGGDADLYISEDTEGSVPASPNHPGGGGSGGGGGGGGGGGSGGGGGGFGAMQDEESLGQEQVTVCKWEGCDAGDLGNMDRLVEHLHDDHIGTRQKKYSCEWSDCSRKGIPHASGYALRAHMRSHTREKPFYCTLPECDRAFTRSDALAKHMRTVHETEALRPSDPVPKHHSSNPSNKNQRVRLVFKTGSTPGASNSISAPEKPGSPLPGSPSAAAAAALPPPPPPPAETEYEHNNITFRAPEPGEPPAPRTPRFPHDIHFSPAELALPPASLARLLRRQAAWAQREAEALRAECEGLERRRRAEWVAKELALENVLEAELGRMGRRDGLLRAEEGAELLEALKADVSVSRGLEVVGEGEAEWRRGFGVGDMGVAVAVVGDGDADADAERHKAAERAGAAEGPFGHRDEANGSGVLAAQHQQHQQQHQGGDEGDDEMDDDDDDHDHHAPLPASSLQHQHQHQHQHHGMSGPPAAFDAAGDPAVEHRPEELGVGLAG